MILSLMLRSGRVDRRCIGSRGVVAPRGRVPAERLQIDLEISPSSVAAVHRQLSAIGSGGTASVRSQRWMARHPTEWERDLARVDPVVLDEAVYYPGPLPTTVTIGATSMLSLNLEHLQVTALAGQPGDVAATMAKMALELAASPLADDIDVVCVGFASGLADTLSRIRTVDVDEAARIVRRRADEVDDLAADLPRSSPALAGRLAGVAASWTPTVVFRTITPGDDPADFDIPTHPPAQVRLLGPVRIDGLAQTSTRSQAGELIAYLALPPRRGRRHPHGDPVARPPAEPVTAAQGRVRRPRSAGHRQRRQPPAAPPATHPPPGPAPCCVAPWNSSTGNPSPATAGPNTSGQTTATTLAVDEAARTLGELDLDAGDTPRLELPLREATAVLTADDGPEADTTLSAELLQLYDRLQPTRAAI